jgi:hypothetical protein
MHGKRDDASCQEVFPPLTMFRAVGCARFSPAETALVMYFLGRSYAGHDGPCKIDVTGLADLWGYDRVSIYRALNGLIAGRVLLATDRRFEINLEWLEWSHEDDSARINSACMIYVETGEAVGLQAKGGRS